MLQRRVQAFRSCADAPGVYFRESLDDLGKFHRGKLFDLVTATYVLSELRTDR